MCRKSNPDLNYLSVLIWISSKADPVCLDHHTYHTYLPEQLCGISTENLIILLATQAETSGDNYIRPDEKKPVLLGFCTGSMTFHVFLG